MEHLAGDLTKRHAHYLQRAEEAERMAKTAKGKLAQDTFQSIAESWRSLAEQASRSIKREL